MGGARPEAVHLCGPEASAGQASGWAARAPAEAAAMPRGLGRLQSPWGLWAPTPAQSLCLHRLIWRGALLAASARQGGGGWDAACPPPCWAAWSSAACCSHPPPLPPPRASLRAERCPSGPPGYRRWVEEVGQARWPAAVGPESSQEQATVWAPGAGGQRCRARWAGGRGALSRGCGQWVPGSPEACSVEGPPLDVAQC